MLSAAVCHHRQQLAVPCLRSSLCCVRHALPIGLHQKDPACSSNTVPGSVSTPLASALQVTLESDSLTQRMDVANTGSAPLKLTAAFHTYFSVGAIGQTKVQRLFRRQPSA